MNRREWLRQALPVAGVALALPAWVAAGEKRARAELVVTPVAEHIHLLTGAGGNVTIFSSPEGVLLVDGGSPERSAEVLRLVKKTTGASKVHTLFNTHWHPEQTGSNERVGKAGARIIAHENTKLWLGYANEVPGQGEPWGPLPPKALPNDTTFRDGKIEFAGEHIEYGHLLQAHTDGDIYVHFRDSNVIAAGGVVSAEGWPVIDYKTGGWIGGLVAGLGDLIRIADANTKIVPANGPVIGKAQLEEQRAMYAAIFDRMGKLLRKGMGPEEVLASNPTKEYDAKWGDPTQFVTLAFKSLWGHFAPDA